jgi:hypothetical protein
VVSFTPRPLHLGERAHVPIEWEAGWIVEPVWTLWRKVSPDGNRNPVVQTVARCYTDGAILTPNPVVRESTNVYSIQSGPWTWSLYFHTAAKDIAVEPLTN